MYAVGSNLLSDFWRAHPAAEGELRALHALIAASDPDALVGALGGIATFDSKGAELRLRSACVKIEISAAAGVARFVAVIPAEEEQT